jgi:D-glycero-D-manno-heptose 1,7-bisphosphate phosphatase
MADAVATQPMAFFDRDGVLNRDIGYAHRSDQIEWIEGALAALALVRASGYRTVIVTNQSGVARGLYGEHDIEDLHAWMGQEIIRAGGHVDAFYYCPYHPEAVVEHYRVDHKDRKPHPGMLHRALSRFPTDHKASFLVGDRQTDLDAAQAAGIAGYLFSDGPLDQLVSDILSGNRAPDNLPLPSFT